MSSSALVALALVSIAAVALTAHSVHLLHRLSERAVVAQGPALCFYLALDERHFNIIYLVVENVGAGMAREVTWTTSPPIDSLAVHHIQTDFLARGYFPQIAPGQRLRTFYANALEVVNAHTPAVQISTTCIGPRGDHVDAHFSLEPNQFRNILTVGETFENEHLKLMKELSKASQELTRSMASIRESTKEISRSAFHLASPIDLRRRLLGSSDTSPSPQTILALMANEGDAYSIQSLEKLLARFAESDEERVLAVLELLRRDGCITFQRMSRYVELTPFGRALARQLDTTNEPWRSHAEAVLHLLRSSDDVSKTWNTADIGRSLSLPTRAVHDAVMLLAERGLVHQDTAIDKWSVRLSERALHDLA